MHNMSNQFLGIMHLYIQTDRCCTMYYTFNFIMDDDINSNYHCYHRHYGKSRLDPLVLSFP